MKYAQTRSALSHVVTIVSKPRVARTLSPPTEVATLTFWTLDRNGTRDILRYKLAEANIGTSAQTVGARKK